jgi:hypothetical protein
MGLLLKPEAWLLLVLWIMPHVFMARAAMRPIGPVLLSLSLIFLASAYLFKPSTGDLPKYSIYFSTGHMPIYPYTVSERGVLLNPADQTGKKFGQGSPGSKGFHWLSKGLTVLPDGPLLPRLSLTANDRYVSDGPVIAILLISCLCLVLACKNFGLFKQGFYGDTRSVIIGISLILGSVFTFVGSQNSLRQFLGICILLLSWSLLHNRRYVFGFLALLAAASFHRWIIVFFCVSAVICFIAKSRPFERQPIALNWINYKVAVYAILFAGFSLLTMKIVLLDVTNQALSLLWEHDVFLPDIKKYIYYNQDYLSPDRVGSFVKLAILFCVYLTSEAILGKYGLTDAPIFRNVRTATFFFIAPFAVFPEVFSRLMHVYLATELLFVVSCFLSTNKRYRWSGAFVFIGYAFAPNAINILLGKEWIYAFS